jgi:hypothetical protein
VELSVGVDGHESAASTVDREYRYTQACAINSVDDLADWRTDQRRIAGRRFEYPQRK